MYLRLHSQRPSCPSPPPSSPQGGSGGSRGVSGSVQGGGGRQGQGDKGGQGWVTSPSTARVVTPQVLGHYSVIVGQNLIISVS